MMSSTMVAKDRSDLVWMEHLDCILLLLWMAIGNLIYSSECMARLMKVSKLILLFDWLFDKAALLSKQQFGNCFKYIFTINVVVNGEVVDYFQMNHDDYVAPPAEGSEGYSFTVANDYSESVLLKLKIGDRVNFYVADLPYPPTENYADGCRTGEITHSCSSITGEYLYL